MRAVWLRGFGEPDALTVSETPDAVAGPGQVLIEVGYANITFVETQVRAGRGPFTPRLPMIMGNGVGGEITEVGPGVDPGLIGRRVVSSTGGSGGYAERVAVDGGLPVEVPAGVRLDDAVALLADGRTALLLTRAAALRAGERVLVEAAAGGVGTLLVQLARAAGATVVAAAGGPAKVAVARDLGAEVAVDYREPGWTGRVRDALDGVDVVFDGVGGAVARASFELLREGGRMLSYGMASGGWVDIPEETAAQRGVTIQRDISASPDELRALTAAALAEAAAGRLRPVIGQRFPLDRVAEAHAAIEGRATIGKTLLEVGVEEAPR